MLTQRQKLLQSFLIGSSYPVFVGFFLRVSQIEKNYSYFHYTLINPLYFGLVNTLIQYLHLTEGYTLEDLYLWASVLSPSLVFLLALTFQTYDFDQRSILTYYLILLFAHGIVFRLILPNLEKSLKVV